MEGYCHHLYVESFSEIGTPIYLPKSKGWLIKRKIPGTEYYDAMGPYPLFFCEYWEYLLEDIDAFCKELVAVSLVIGPLEVFPLRSIREFFDVFFEYKSHYILDTAVPIEEVISTGRRRDALKALNDVEVDLKISPDINLDEWCHLYNNLIIRHQISGIRTFSRESFKIQLAIPNTHYFRVIKQGEVVGGALFYLQKDSSYYHLAAQTEKGYEMQAGYAAMWTAINVLSKKIRWIELQGGSSQNDEEMDGLSGFKKGWANLEKKSLFCGKIINYPVYSEISKIKKIPKSQWFPAYRVGEFS